MSDAELAAPKRPSGHAYPRVTTDAIEPMPVVLTWQTIFKLTGPLMAVLLGAAVTVVSGWFEVRAHLTDQQRHLSPQDRAQLATRSEVQADVKHVLDQVEVRLHEAQLQQRELLRDLQDEMKAAQARGVTQIKTVLRETRTPAPKQAPKPAAKAAPKR